MRWSPGSVPEAGGRRPLLLLAGDAPDRVGVAGAERFAGGAENGYNLVAQGGGDYANGHRCPGEMVTVEITKATLRLLAAEIAYEVPPQDLDINLARMPTLPNSGFVMEALRPAR